MAFERFKKFNIDKLIAKNPAEPRDSSRLMVLNRANKTIENKIFRDLPQYLKAGDTIVINNSKVFPAKIFAKKITGGKMEILLAKQLEDKFSWAVLLREYKPEAKLIFEDGLEGEIIGSTAQGEAIIKFNAHDILPYARKYGQMPLPPYIEKARAREGLPKSIKSDREKYQTIYAQAEGSIAAPTAGFHFTRDLLNKIKAKGVNIVYITLHVGWGTFKPLRGEPRHHQMLAELAEVSQETAQIINETKTRGGRIFAVGTTSTRTLESFANAQCRIEAGLKWTDLFIYGDYKFESIDALITNFHFPDSTPLCLACAFAGEDFIYNAYSQAVEQKYRFYSFGDTMLIL
jgi:S-adenosylmethionine:tRNA ribosyltransferase-isomerase